MSESFEEWAERVLGPLVVGVNDDEWYRCEECWEAAQAAMRGTAGEGYDAYWQREYAQFNIEGADRGFGEVVWRDARLAR